MMQSWSFYIAGRYLLTNSGRKGHLGNLLAVLGLTIGILTLITVLTVMNGFQQGFITSINEVYSYHIRVEEPTVSPEEFRREVAGISNISHMVPFADYQAILTSPGGFSSGIQIRMIDEKAALEDKGFMEQITMPRGEFSFSGEKTILLGADLARSVNALTGDKVTLTFLNIHGGNASLQNRTYTVGGVFRTGYYEYDRNLAFASLDSLVEEQGAADLVYGIKLKRHFWDLPVMDKLKDLSGISASRIVSWRTYNSAFFNALKIEKTFMLLIVGLIFIVVAVNIYHSMKRSVRERLEELALLKAIGGTPGQIRKIFFFQGLFIGLCGCLSGTVLGILISLHINGIMDFFVYIVDLVRLGWYTITGKGESYRASLFYFTDIPVYLMVKDLIIINAAALISILIAAAGSIRTYASVNPAEIFRNE